MEENPRSKAAALGQGLAVTLLWGDGGALIDSVFADVRYQLLTGTAGTVADAMVTKIFQV